ncbi:bacterial translation initiation factor 2 (bIF-2) [Tistlia consotensis]|uniref:Translation initiation factor IF-2 n=2 Tax=Tistlia TaxID=1321364 RepID=A0A1Y6CLH9_9PROT|nr:bacterial translation initiation factor 2 (bIF-2) [Tistlia consotensis USBA 355]SNS10843.1 bacterial translation initiation factor 2 (bIF-2) [Tistlia consotensis]
MRVLEDMSTNNESQEAKKPLTLNRPKKLELKKTVETGQVRQSFSHGRTKTVQVEVKRKRTYRPGDGGKMTAVAEEAQAEEAEAEARQRPIPEALRNLRPEEREARMRALEQAKEDTARREAEEAERRQREAEEAERRRLEAEERARREADEAARRAAAGLPEAPAAAEVAEPEAPAEAGPAEPEPEAAEPAGEPAAAPVAREVERVARPTPKTREAEQEEARLVKKKVAAKAPAPSRAKGEPKRRQGKLTISQALDDEGNEDRIRSLAAVRRQREREKQRAREQLQSGQKIVREVTIPEAITVQELANRMAERGGEVVKTLMKMGVMATITQSIDADTAELVVEEFGHRSKRVSAQDVEIGLRGSADDDALLRPRAPVVTVMGHVDHGKTSLLDALRKTDVAAHEAGGITQHIGAYQIEVPSGDKITFLDTPGHAAFSEMRSRGANVTDIVILVVAADDGIMAQTIEAINHAKAAGVPIIVAINKIDVPGANPNKVKQALLQHELVPEDMGGDVICVEVSAKTRQGLDNLLDILLLQAELLELKANPERNAEGTVVESKLEQGRGAVATVLVQRGTLKVGDIFVAGAESGRVRALLNDRGERVESAGPSVPVEVLGLSGTPEAGDDLVVVEDEARAREIASFRADKKKTATMATQGRGTLEQMLSAIREGEAKTMPLIVKADVHGSLEAILGALEKMATEEVRPEILHSAVGGINESDVTLARASGAMILAFNVRANAQARDLAKRDGVDIRYYSIIYELIDEMRKALGGLLAPEQREVFLGYAEIREVFNITKVGKVAGCMVTEGTVKRGAKVRLLRDDVVVHAGTLKTLKRFKDEVREVQQGYECGMAFEHYEDIAVGDRIECYEVEEVARTL